MEKVRVAGVGSGMEDIEAVLCIQNISVPGSELNEINVWIVILCVVRPDEANKTQEEWVRLYEVFRGTFAQIEVIRMWAVKNAVHLILG